MKQRSKKRKLNVPENIIGIIKKNKINEPKNITNRKRKKCDCCKNSILIKNFCNNKRQEDGKNKTCKDCCNIRNNKFQTENKEYFNQYKIKNYSKLKEKWTINNRSRSKEENAINNKKQILKGNKAKWSAKQLKTNFQFRIRQILGSRLFFALKGKGKKLYKTQKLLGCTIKEFKIWLEKQFINGMTWENYGKVWEIDHFKPCASFDLTKEEDQKECFHYINLMPRFKTTEIAEQFGSNQIGNRDKGDKIL